MRTGRGCGRGGFELREQRAAGGKERLVVIVDEGVAAAASGLQSEEARPARRDVGDRLEEAGGVAAGGKGRESLAEGGEVGFEEGAVLGLEGVQPASAGKEPVSSKADGCEVSDT